ncbi:unnamed protein product [Auanema sp. JU1783]|nr:unnamed protein product [Auanema sp. JU1783]
MSTKKAKSVRTSIRSETIIPASPNDSASSSFSFNGSILETSRAQEKEQLTGLNSRLAMYIEKVRQLEQENNRLTVQIRDVEIVEKRERSSIVNNFDAEKKRLRGIIDDLEKREARAVIERDTAVAEHDRLLAKANKLERDLAKENETKIYAQSLADDATAKLKNLQNRLEKIEADNNELNRENTRVNTQLSSIQKALEDECLQRTVAQNELARATEDLAFQKRQHDAALDEVSRKRQVEMTTYQKQVSQEFQSKLQESLSEMRQQLQDQLNNSHGLLEDQYKTKLSEAQQSRDDALEEASSLRYRLKEEGGHSALIASLRNQLVELEQQMQDRLSAKDLRIADLNKEISRLLTEFHNLLDNKIQLDAELNAYRVLLEAEEERLNISSQNANTSMTRTSLLSASKSGQPGRKRARIEVDGEDNFSVHATKERLVKETVGPIGIDEVDPEGAWVRIENYSEDEVTIAKWTIEVRASDREVSYRFNNKMKLAGGASCTVYSATTGHKSHLPDTITMKSESWPVGENPSARLLDGEGDLVSSMSLLEGEYTDSSNPGDRCSIM